MPSGGRKYSLGFCACVGRWALLRCWRFAVSAVAGESGEPDDGAARSGALSRKRTCKLQTLATRPRGAGDAATRSCSTRAPVGRRSAGELRADAARAIGRCRSRSTATIPGCDLCCLRPQRPVVIDVAVFIDGKPYSRTAREAWIDELLRQRKPGGTKRRAAWRSQ